MNDNRNKPGLLEKAKGQPQYMRAALHKIRRARTRLLVCFLTLPVYMIALWVLLSNGREIDTFMYVYMALWAVFAIDMVMRRCPRCGEQFYVKTIILNLITHRCVHCGLDEAAIEEEAASGDASD